MLAVHLGIVHHSQHISLPHPSVENHAQGTIRGSCRSMLAVTQRDVALTTEVPICLWDGETVWVRIQVSPPVYRIVIVTAVGTRCALHATLLYPRYLPLAASRSV
jgi:hypothetical protein